MRWILIACLVLLVIPLTNALVFDYYLGQADLVNIALNSKQSIDQKQFLMQVTSCGSSNRVRCAERSNFRASVDGGELPLHKSGHDNYACYKDIVGDFAQTVSLSGGGPGKVDGHRCYFAAYANAFFYENFTKKQASITFSDKDAKRLGTISELLGPVNVNEATIFSYSDDVLVWIGDNTEFGKKTTSDLSQTAWACLDSNKNQQCDYDEGKKCIEKGGAWYNGYCCGVDYEPGYYEQISTTRYAPGPIRGGATTTITATINAICGQNIGGDYDWLPLEEVGRERAFDEPEGLFISDGEKFYHCGGDKNFITGNKISKLEKKRFSYKGDSNEYICTQENEIISCGGNKPFSENAKVIGEKTTYQNKEMYCSSSGIFVDDLDVADEETCNSAGFAWTGTKCCEDPESEPEYYNDPYDFEKVKQGFGGGCWNSKFIARGRTIQDIKSLINHNGEFQGCKYSQATSIQITSHQECSILENSAPDQENKHAVCQPNGNWVLDSDLSTKTKKKIAWNADSGQIIEGCCSSTQCWAGNQCKNQNEYFATDAGLGFQCTSSGWKSVPVKYSWDRKTDAGFCELDSQCLVDPSGNSALNGKPETWFENKRPVCINNNQYILDPYCENGKWTSRTRNIALTLLTIAEQDSTNDYTLFCGHYDKVLPSLDYSVAGGDVRQYFESFCNPFNSQEKYNCVNNICVLKYSKGIGIGTSLNIPINDKQKSILNSFELDSEFCSNVDSRNNFYAECSPGQLQKSSIFYYPNQHTILYLPKGSIPSPLLTSSDAFKRFLKQPIDAIIAYARTASTKIPFAEFFTDQGIFNNIYVSSKSTIRVFAVLEEHQTKKDVTYLGIKYSGTELKEKSCSDLFKIYDIDAQCTKQPLPFDFLLVAKKYAEEASLIKFWNELTGSIRQ